QFLAKIFHVSGKTRARILLSAERAIAVRTLRRDRRNLIMSEHLLQLENSEIVRMKPQQQVEQGLFLNVVESVIEACFLDIRDFLTVSDLSFHESLVPLGLVDASDLLDDTGGANLNANQLIIEVVTEQGLISLAAVNTPPIQRKGLINLAGT